MIGPMRAAIVVTLCCMPALTACSAGPSCPTPHLVETETEFLRATATCGPEDLPEDADISTAGTIITVIYETLAMPCGGRVVVELDPAGERLTLAERVEDTQGVCGCFNWFRVTAEIEVCEPGSYVVVVNGLSHTVTI